MVNVKTPNKKRKSVGNADGVAVSPKNSPGKTPGKNKSPGKPNQTPGKPKPGPGKANQTPGKQNQTPGKPNQTIGKPNQTPGKAKQTPGKPNQTPKGGQNTPKPTPLKNQKNLNNKRNNESITESSSPKKMKKFGGTGELQTDKQAPKQAKKKGDAQAKKKGTFFHLKEKLDKGDKSAVEELDAKIKIFADRKELSKTAKRKLKILIKLREKMTGEKKEVTLKSQLKQNEKKQPAKAKNQKAGNAKAKAPAKKPAAGNDEEASSESEEESELKPNSIIKKIAEAEGDDDAEEEESDDGEEEESDDDESEDEEIPTLVPLGGKKKGQEKKNEVKAKNLKLQAMRKQGQLAGSVKENQKRSARRAKKNAKPVNGAH